MATTQPLSRLALKPCTNCRARKVKCDKLQPCSQCIRFNKTCVYEDPGNPAAAAASTGNLQSQAVQNELAERVAKLEGLLSGQTQFSATPVGVTAASRAPFRDHAIGISDAIHSALGLQASPQGRLVREGERSRFVDSAWFGSLFEEVCCEFPISCNAIQGRERDSHVSRL
jgi:hypothetical protein